MHQTVFVLISLLHLFNPKRDILPLVNQEFVFVSAAEITQVSDAIASGNVFCVGQDPAGFQEEAQSSEGYTTPHSVGTRIHQDTSGYTTPHHSVGTPHQPSRSLSGLDTASLPRHNTSNARSASWRQSYQRHSTSDLLEELKGCKVQLFHLF